MLTDDTMLGIKRRNMNAPKEIKVKLPVGQLIKLHILKLAANEEISGTVTKALDAYFAEQAILARKSASAAPNLAMTPTTHAAGPSPMPGA